MIRVFVVARSEVVRAGLVSLLEGTDEAVYVTGSAPSWNGGISHDADVILADSDDDAGETDRDQALRTPVVLLTDDTGVSALQDRIRSGVRAVLPRAASAAEIIGAVYAAASGLIALPVAAWESDPVAPRPISRDVEALTEELTSRELEVLRLVAAGESNKAIAWKLGISEHTVKFHLSSIFPKLRVSSRTEAVAAGVRLGLIML